MNQLNKLNWIVSWTRWRNVNPTEHFWDLMRHPKYVNVCLSKYWFAFSDLFMLIKINLWSIRLVARYACTNWAQSTSFCSVFTVMPFFEQVTGPGQTFLLFLNTSFTLYPKHLRQSAPNWVCVISGPAKMHPFLHCLVTSVIEAWPENKLKTAPYRFNATSDWFPISWLFLSM